MREEHVELLEPAESGIHVASYLTELLSKKQLKRKLRESVRLARARLHTLRLRDTDQARS
jgi:hypothetical protein